MYHRDLLAKGAGSGPAGARVMKSCQSEQLQVRGWLTKFFSELEVGTCEIPWKRKGPCGCRYMAHLEVSEVPGAVIILNTLPGERGAEVNLDQLPVRAEADVAKDPEGRKTH